MTEELAAPDGMDVTLLLADAASANPNGTLDVRNLGWWSTRPEQHAHTLLVWITVPAARAGIPIRYSARLVDSDGRPVEDDTPRGVEQVGVDGRVTVSADPDLPAGHPITSPPAFFGVKILRRLRSGVYEWRCDVEGQSRPHWRRAFVVRG